MFATAVTAVALLIIFVVVWRLIVKFEAADRRQHVLGWLERAWDAVDKRDFTFNEPPPDTSRFPEYGYRVLAVEGVLSRMKKKDLRLSEE